MILQEYRIQKIIMINIPKQQSPFQRIITKLVKYILFTIGVSWSPVLFNLVIAKFFKLHYKELYLYFSEILFMTIILSSTNIKDISESKIDKDSFIFLIHIIVNVINIIICIILISISSFAELSNTTFDDSVMKENFIYIMIMYILAVFLGICVQTGGEIKQVIDQNKREGE